MKLNKLIFGFLLLPSTLFGGQLNTNSARTIIAPKIEYNAKSSEIRTTGKTEISNTSGQKITLLDSYLTKNGSSASGTEVQLWLNKNTHITADSVVRKNEDTLATAAVFTTCYECDKKGNAWEISAKQINHDMETHIIEFYNPVFWVYHLPLFWFPYLTMSDPSVKYKSGFLLPDFNSTNKMGTQFNIPFYLSLSDMHDATITASYLTAENPLFMAEHRLNLRHSEFRTTGSFTRNKNSENRWHMFNNDVVELGENMRAKIYLQRASDKTYLQKYGFYGDQPYLDSGAKLELFGTSGYVVADAHLFQELRNSSGNYADPSGDILPNIRGKYQTNPFFFETYAGASADILGVSGTNSTSQRLIGETFIVSPWTLWGGNRITAAASGRYDLYNFNNTEIAPDSEFSGVKTRFLPSGYLEWGLPLLRPDSGSGWTQIIEPRARFTVMQNLSDSQFMLNTDSAGALLSDATLFSDKRFAGMDLWENGNYADYGARIAAFDKTGQNIEAFFGQSYDFTTRAQTDVNSGFHDGKSDYVGRLSYKKTNFLDLSSRFRFSENQFDLRHIENNARVGTSRNYIDLGHIWAEQFTDTQTLDKSINELVSGFGVQITGRTQIKWNAVYNLTESSFQRHTGGIYYEHPCYFLAVEYRRDNSRKNDYVGNTSFKFRFGITLGDIKKDTQ